MRPLDNKRSEALAFEAKERREQRSPKLIWRVKLDRATIFAINVFCYGPDRSVVAHRSSVIWPYRAGWLDIIERGCWAIVVRCEETCANLTGPIPSGGMAQLHRVWVVFAYAA